MNNRGQGSLGIAIIVAITFFIVGMISLNFVRESIDTARLPQNMNCSNPESISDGTKLACLTIDLVLPYLIIVIISISGGAIAGRFLG